jgi:hypothetical protein
VVRSTHADAQAHDWKNRLELCLTSAYLCPTHVLTNYFVY